MGCEGDPRQGASVWMAVGQVEGEQGSRVTPLQDARSGPRGCGDRRTIHCERTSRRKTVCWWEEIRHAELDGAGGHAREEAPSRRLHPKGLKARPSS